jgi:F0F1-type ATP synthase assembly protein I
MTLPSRDPSQESDRDVVADYRAREREQREMGQWQRISGAGIEFAIAIGLFALAGWGLDRWLGISPWGLIGGVAAGFAVGLTLLIRVANKMFK